jgi:hypothetical protein
MQQPRRDGKLIADQTAALDHDQPDTGEILLNHVNDKGKRGIRTLEVRIRGLREKLNPLLPKLNERRL